MKEIRCLPSVGRVQEGPGQAAGQVRLFWTCCGRCSESRAGPGLPSPPPQPRTVSGPRPLTPIRCTLASVVYPRRGPPSRVGGEGCAEGLALTSRGPPFPLEVAGLQTSSPLDSGGPVLRASALIPQLGQARNQGAPPAADARGVPSEGLVAAAGGALPSALRGPTCPRQGDLWGCPLSINHQDKGRGTRVRNLSHPAASPLKKEGTG